jgi:hypothetical protein
MRGDDPTRRGSPYDPNGLIGQVLEMGAEFAGPAEDVIFSWLISLARDIDPAVAADRLLDEYGLRDGAVPPGAIGRLWTLLRETALYPDARLRASAGRRRGGRRRQRH